MSKTILISIKPKWVAKILNGEKTIEIRKTMPKCDLPIQVYIYCTKGDVLEYFYDTNDNFGEYITHKEKCWGDEQLNGKVVAKFTLNKVEEIMFMKGVFVNETKLLEQSCLNGDELFWYLAPQDTIVRNCGYSWHISNLVIFDRPKELSEFSYLKPSICGKKDNNGLYQCDKCIYGNKESLECRRNKVKAPQSWCYVEESL